MAGIPCCCNMVLESNVISRSSVLYVYTQIAFFGKERLQQSTRLRSVIDNLNASLKTSHGCGMPVCTEQSVESW